MENLKNYSLVGFNILKLRNANINTEHRIIGIGVGEYLNNKLNFYNEMILKPHNKEVIIPLDFRYFNTNMSELESGTDRKEGFQTVSNYLESKELIIVRNLYEVEMFLASLKSYGISTTLTLDKFTPISSVVRKMLDSEQNSELLANIKEYEGLPSNMVNDLEYLEEIIGEILSKSTSKIPKNKLKGQALRDTLSGLIDSQLGEGLNISGTSLSDIITKFETEISQLETKEELAELYTEIVKELNLNDDKYTYRVTFPEKEKLLYSMNKVLHNQLELKEFNTDEYYMEALQFVGYKKAKEKLGYTTKHEFRRFKRDYVYKASIYLKNYTNKMVYSRQRTKILEDFAKQVENKLDSDDYGLANQPQVKQLIYKELRYGLPIREYYQRHSADFDYYLTHGKFQHDEGNRILEEIITRFTVSDGGKQFPKGVPIKTLLKPIKDFDYNVPSRFKSQVYNYGQGWNYTLSKLFGTKDITEYTDEHINTIMLFLYNFKESYTIESIMENGLKPLLDEFFYLPIHGTSNNIGKRVKRMNEYLQIYSNNDNGIFTIQTPQTIKPKYPIIELRANVDNKSTKTDSYLVIGTSDMYIVKYIKEGYVINQRIRKPEDTFSTLLDKYIDVIFKELYKNQLDFTKKENVMPYMKKFYTDLKPLFDLRRKTVDPNGRQ